MNRIIIIGYGVQGKKRFNLLKKNVVAIVDPIEKSSAAKKIEDINPDTYDTAFICTPDNQKKKILESHI